MDKTAQHGNPNSILALHHIATISLLDTYCNKLLMSKLDLCHIDRFVAVDLIDYWGRYLKHESVIYIFNLDCCTCSSSTVMQVKIHTCLHVKASYIGLSLVMQRSAGSILYVCEHLFNYWVTSYMIFYECNLSTLGSYAFCKLCFYHKKLDQQWL